MFRLNVEIIEIVMCANFGDSRSHDRELRSPQKKHKTRIFGSRNNLLICLEPIIKFMNLRICEAKI